MILTIEENRLLRHTQKLLIAGAISTKTALCLLYLIKIETEGRITDGSEQIRMAVLQASQADRRVSTPSIQLA